MPGDPEVSEIRQGDSVIEALTTPEAVLNEMDRINALRAKEMIPFPELRDQINAVMPIAQSVEEAEAKKRETQNQITRRKIIITDERLRDITDRALTALIDSNNPPFVFIRSRNLVRVGTDEHGLPVIEPLTKAAVRGVIERCAEFYVTTSKGNEKTIFPPKDVVDDLMALPAWNLPPLKGILECPVILPSGIILSVAGYDSGTRLYYAPAYGLNVPKVPDTPTRQDVDRAVNLIGEIFIDFPFVDGASRTNMIAALMTAVLRPTIPGNVPMAILDKPQAGTGASLLAEIIALVATGRIAAPMTAPENDAEWRKSITSTLQYGRNLVIVDNVESKMQAAPLAALLTSQSWTDRILGCTEIVTLPHFATWICTGNNVLLGGDLPRRCYWIRLDAQNARPWQRTGYRHPDLPGWVKLKRGEILAAILTLARAWMQAGKPRPTEAVPKLGGFEGWRETIGGILEYCGLPAFLLNLEEMYDQADADGPQWEAFFDKWHSVWGVRPVTVAEIHALMQKEGDSLNVAYGSERLVDLLPDVLADAWSGKKNFARVLGKSLSRMNGRKFLSGLTLRKGKDAHKVATWIVSPLEQQRPDKRGVL
jgi:hypothetical protein